MVFFFSFTLAHTGYLRWWSTDDLSCSIAGGQSDGVVIPANQLCVLSAIYGFCKGSFGRT